MFFPYDYRDYSFLSRILQNTTRILHLLSAAYKEVYDVKMPHN